MQTTCSNHRSQLVSSLCTVYRAVGFNCRRCADHCPMETVEIGPHGPRIGEKCIGCGICFAACPNGAFRVTGSDGVASRLRAAAAEAVKETGLRISCRHGDVAADVVLPCLAGLTEALLLAPFEEGVAGIELLHPSCSGCKWHRAATLISETVSRAQKILEMIGLSANDIRLCDTRLKTPDASVERSMSRRGLLREIGAKALQAAAEKVPVISDESGETASDGEYQENLRKRWPYEKRNQLLRGINGFKGRQVVEIPASLAPFAEVFVTEQCTGCRACATLCPTGAISLDEDDVSFRLKFKAHLCSNCQLCNGLCKHGALHSQKEVVLNRLFESEESILFQSEKKRCQICGLDFVGGGNGACAHCTGRIKKQQDLVRNLTIAEIR